MNTESLNESTSLDWYLYNLDILESKDMYQETEVDTFFVRFVTEDDEL